MRTAGERCQLAGKDSANRYWRRRMAIEQEDEAASDDCFVDLVADELRDSNFVERRPGLLPPIGFEPRTASLDRRLGSIKMQIAGRE